MFADRLEITAKTQQTLQTETYNPINQYPFRPLTSKVIVLVTFEARYQTGPVTNNTRTPLEAKSTRDQLHCETIQSQRPFTTETQSTRDPLIPETKSARDLKTQKPSHRAQGSQRYQKYRPRRSIRGQGSLRETLPSSSIFV